MHKTWQLVIIFTFIFACISNAGPVLEVKSYPLAGQLEGLEKEVLDFRYQPAKGQCCIGWPDDFYKTIVASDGRFNFRFNGMNWANEYFDISLKASVVSDKKVDKLSQSLWDPKVAIVKTDSSVDGLELNQVAFAGAVEGEKPSDWIPSRADYLYLKMKNTTSTDKTAQVMLSLKSYIPWKLSDDGSKIFNSHDPKEVLCFMDPPCSKVEYPKGVDTAFIVKNAPEIKQLQMESPDKYDWRFRSFMVGWNRPVDFKYSCQTGKKYKVAFGLVENFYDKPEYRKQDYKIEGKTVLTVDAAEFGKAKPVVKIFDAQDINGDGVLDLGIYSSQQASDRNTVFGPVFIFAADDCPTDEQILAGKYQNKLLAVLDKNTLLQSNEVKIYFDQTQLKSGEEFKALVTFPGGEKSSAAKLGQAEKLLKDSVNCWQQWDIPYGNIQVADAEIQKLLDSCIRNIYQAREIKNGRPAFQVGPTCYRGTWAADGPFILESVCYMGRLMEVREGLENQIDIDSGPQGGFSKKHGLRLWMVRRHGQLTDDKAWLEKMWPKVEREVNTIRQYRKKTKENPDAINYGLMPPEFGDGGLGGQWKKDYTSVYWTMAGLKAAIEMAEILNKPCVEDWKAEYADYWKCFDKARNRDKLVDEFGNTYVPVVLKGEEKAVGEEMQMPQRGAWAFMQSIYPGRIFDKDDELMLSTVAMLDSYQKEGLIQGTGWLPEGVWNYAASFYGHVHLWLGHGKKTAATFYAFANHASEMLCWREEQNIVGDKFNMCGDMPHNWASGEFIRMARHMIMLERGSELHLFEALPVAWTKPGDKTVLKDIPTTFGKAGVELVMSKNGKFANVKIDVPDRDNLSKIVLHLEQFNKEIKSVTDGWHNIQNKTINISPDKKLSFQIKFK